MPPPTTEIVRRSVVDEGLGVGVERLLHRTEGWHGKHDATEGTRANG